MNKEGFLAELHRALGRMAESEKKEILYDYEEHFRMGAAEGKDEEEISRSLGNPRALGRSYAIESLPDRPEERGGGSASLALRALFASLSLTVFNVIFVLGPFLGLVGAMVGLWAAAAAVALSGVAVALAVPLWALLPFLPRLSVLQGFFFFFSGTGVASLGLLSVIGMWKLSLLFARATVAYVKLNARIVAPRR